MTVYNPDEDMCDHVYASRNDERDELIRDLEKLTGRSVTFLKQLAVGMELDLEGTKITVTGQKSGKEYLSVSIQDLVDEHEKALSHPLLAEILEGEK